MAARVGTPTWRVGVALTHQPAYSFFTRRRLPFTGSGLRVNVGPSLVLPHLLAVAPAEQSAQDNLPPPPSDQVAPEEESGPIQLPDDEDPFASPSVSPLQSAGSILFTGVLGVFLFRSLRRRAKLAKETKFRSSGLENIKEASKKEPLSIANPESSGIVVKSPPSAFQTFQGAVIAGVFAVVLYKFATYVEAGFAAKPVSPVYTIRQLTITIRTIVNGLCYLATFVFAANSIGLTMYSLQLLFNPGPAETSKKGSDKSGTDEDPSESESLVDVKKD